MATKPVTRDDGKTVTGHVWTKDEEPTGCGCYKPVQVDMTQEQADDYFKRYHATEAALKGIKPMSQEELIERRKQGETERASEEPGDAFAREVVRNMAAKLDDEITKSGCGCYKNLGEMTTMELNAFVARNGNPYKPGWPKTPAELEQFARQFFDRCLEVMRAKNARYAGEEDPFRNLRRGGVFGIAVRMDDKVSRMLTLSHPLNKLDGLDESIEDTAVDMANYAMLMLALKTNLGGK